MSVRFRIQDSNAAVDSKMLRIGLLLISAKTRGNRSTGPGVLGPAGERQLNTRDSGSILASVEATFATSLRALLKWQKNSG